MAAPTKSSPHAMLAQATAAEQSQEDFTRQLSLLLEVKLRPAIGDTYRRRVGPALRARLGREPDHREIAAEMRTVPANQAWYALRTYNQQRMFRLGCEVVERQRPEMMSRAERYRTPASLKLDDAVKPPRYLAALDTHLQPGGYHTEEVANDLSAGAVFDRVISVHTMGSQGPNNDDAGMSVAGWVQKEHPELTPKRILDLGCTVGHFTLPFKQVFPDAEVYGIDVAAPCLRYAHARACAQGVEAHFRQANAEAMPFDDESFDLVVSRQLLHETSVPALRNVFHECFRLLKPQGLMIHQDAPQFDQLDPYTASLRDWDIHFNNEPFMATCYELPLEKMYVEAGFRTGRTFRTFTPSLYCALNNVNKFATRSAAGRYFFSGAQK